MPIIIPMRVLTMVIGCILGYSAGFWIELQYKTHGDYRGAVQTLLQGIKDAVHWEDDLQSDEEEGFIYSSGDEKPHYHIGTEDQCCDCCDSGTSFSDSD